MLIGHHDPFGYFPMQDGRLLGSSPMLIKLPNYGNIKDKTFQFDNQFHAYRNTKIKAKSKNPGQYYQTLNSVSKSDAFEYIINTLVHEWPDKFQYTNNLFLCKLTGESLFFLDKREYFPQYSKPALHYQDGFDALAMQVQEDLLLHYHRPGGVDKVDTVSIHFPHTLSADGIIGASFEAIATGLKDHRGQPVIRFPAHFLRSLINSNVSLERVGFVEFVEGADLSSTGADRSNKSFGSGNNIFIRFDRQVVRGLPSSRAFLMTSKPYFVKTDHSHSVAQAIIQALQNPSPDAYDIDFVNKNKEAILIYLENV